MPTKAEQDRKEYMDVISAIAEVVSNQPKNWKPITKLIRKWGDPEFIPEEEGLEATLDLVCGILLYTPDSNAD